MHLNNRYSPIALFIYNRPIHTERTISALLECQELLQSPLHIFCDGAEVGGDVRQVECARDVARKLLPSHAVFHYSSANKGLASSIEQGVSKVCNEYGSVIVLEDDLVVGRSFLAYMNAALDKYKTSERVMQVSAYKFPIDSESVAEQCVLLPIATSWGWATWRESWLKYDPFATGWEKMKTDLRVREIFNLNGTFDYYSMLKNQMEGKSDSWAIRWYWSIFRNEGLVVYPPGSMVQNIGFDGSGTHGWRTSRACFFVQDLFENKRFTFPESEKHDDAAYLNILRYLREIEKRPSSRLKRLVKKLL